MAARQMNKPEGICSREEPVRHTGESRKEQYIRGRPSPVYIHVGRPSGDGQVIMSHHRNLRESVLVRQKAGTPGYQ